MLVFPEPRKPDNSVTGGALVPSEALAAGMIKRLNLSRNASNYKY
jgi:hypothetical protein